MAASHSAVSPLRRRPVQSVSSRRDATDVSTLGQTSFACEGEDARLTGMTRSPLRRLMGLNLPGATLRRTVTAVPRVA